MEDADNIAGVRPCCAGFGHTMSIRAWIIAALFVAGCGHHGPRTVADPDPAVKIPAIKQAVRSGNRSVIPQLVKDLGSDDPAVRFYAIDALHEFTGQTLGYRYFDEDEQRKTAVEKWKKWLSQQPKTSK